VNRISRLQEIIDQLGRDDPKPRVPTTYSTRWRRRRRFSSPIGTGFWRNSGTRSWSSSPGCRQRWLERYADGGFSHPAAHGPGLGVRWRCASHPGR